MKAILKDGTELQLNSLTNITDTRIRISFASVAGYDVLRAKVNQEAMKVIKYYAGDDTSYSVYEGYSKFIFTDNVTELPDGTSDVVMTFEKPTTTEMEIAQLKKDNLMALNATAYLYELILNMPTA